MRLNWQFKMDESLWSLQKFTSIYYDFLRSTNPIISSTIDFMQFPLDSEYFFKNLDQWNIHYLLSGDHRMCTFISLEVFVHCLYIQDFPKIVCCFARCLSEESIGSCQSSFAKTYLSFRIHHILIFLLNAK